MIGIHHIQVALYVEVIFIRYKLPKVMLLNQYFEEYIQTHVFIIEDTK